MIGGYRAVCCLGPGGLVDEKVASNMSHNGIGVSGMGGRGEQVGKT